MGQNLLKAGHPVVIYSRTWTRPEVGHLVQAGATYVASPVEVGSRASVVITIERARPILSSLGTNIYHCGPTGCGAVAKLSNNWIYLASMVGVVQVARMAQRVKSDEATTHGIWLKSTGDCIAVRTHVPFHHVVQNNPIDQDYRPGYPIEHALKDLKLIDSNARELGISTLGLPEVISVYEAGVQQGLAKKDISAIAEVLP
jgi:3-hydroxyisobutyrate dehydrogenase